MALETLNIHTQHTHLFHASLKSVLITISISNKKETVQWSRHNFQWIKSSWESSGCIWSGRRRGKTHKKQKQVRFFLCVSSANHWVKRMDWSESVWDQFEWAYGTQSVAHRVGFVVLVGKLVASHWLLFWSIQWVSLMLVGVPHAWRCLDVDQSFREGSGNRWQAAQL